VATKSKAGLEAILDPALTEKLHMLDGALSDAHNLVEELTTGLKDRDVEIRELSWLMQGFTADAMLDAGNIVEMLLELRSRAMGGLLPNEVDLLRAVGGDH
jgi:hypothetical protein